MQTRWLSLSSCLRTLLKIYGAVLSFLGDEATRPGPGRARMAAKAKELLDRMLDLDVILGMRSISLLVESLRTLSMKLQTRNLSHAAAWDYLTEISGIIEDEYIRSPFQV